MIRKGDISTIKLIQGAFKVFEMGWSHAFVLGVLGGGGRVT